MSILIVSQEKNRTEMRFFCHSQTKVDEDAQRCEKGEKQEERTGGVKRRRPRSKGVKE